MHDLAMQVRHLHDVVVHDPDHAHAGPREVLQNGRAEAAGAEHEHAGVFEAALALDVTPLSDLRASAAYRLKVAGNLIERLIHEAAPEAPETRLATVGAPAHA